jgi:hypothetical protein
MRRKYGIHPDDDRVYNAIKDVLEQDELMGLTKLINNEIHTHACHAKSQSYGTGKGSRRETERLVVAQRDSCIILA